MTRLFFFAFLLLGNTALQAQNTGARDFWNQLQKLCGQSFEGQIEQAPPNDPFSGKTLLMHVRACEPNRIRIPFMVGDDRSRTWVLTLENDRITLKHDHRHEDGSEDEITQYGGTSPNSGAAGMQFFPADDFTCNLIDYACANIWWITLDDKSFTYNLRRLGSDRVFSIRFDLTQAVKAPQAPWGWKD